MARWWVLVWLGAGLALGACGAAGPERIVLVTIDTLRADRVGAYGYERAETPVLDALAARGVLFETAIAPAPLTLPSHATLLTGLDPPRHGVRHNGVFRLDASLPTLTERLAASGRTPAAVVAAVVLERRHGLDRGFAHYDDEMGAGRSGLVGYAERPADQVVDRALAWLADAPERFFLWVHFYDPHAGYQPPAPFAGRFRSAPYDGEVAFVDRELGRLLAGVDARFGAAGTLVVVTSDHGESLGEHGEPTHSYSIYDATQRVPLILAGPGMRSGARIATPVALADLAPTLLALAGAEPLEDVDGRDLSPLLDGGEIAPRAAYLETLATQLDFGWSALVGLRTERWKYVRAPRPELYDLARDPGETQNRFDAAPERAAELERQLAERLAGASPPPARVVTLSATERARLEALGYVVPGELPEPERLGVTQGPDPKDQMELLARAQRAELLLERGRPDRAKALLADVDAPGPQILALRAAAGFRAGDFEDAERDAEACLALDPLRSDAWATLAAVHELQGRFEPARDAYARAEALPPRSGAATLGLGRTLEALGEHEAAYDAYRRALADASLGSEPLWRLAALSLERDGEEAARVWLDRLDVDAQLAPGAALRLAQAELVAGRAERAEVRLRESWRRHPDDPRLALAYAGRLEHAGRLDEALRLREQVLAAHPDTPVARNEVAWTLARMGRDLDRALALAREAAALAADAPSILDTLAEVHLARDEPRAALGVVERALAVSGESGRLLYLRAAALAGAGRREAARAALDRSLALEPEGGAHWHGARAKLAAELGAGAES